MIRYYLLLNSKELKSYNQKYGGEFPWYNG